MRHAVALLLGLLLTHAAWAQEGSPSGPVPTAVGQAATGQIPGISTNTAANAGNVGELQSVTCPNSSSVTATFTNGSAVIDVSTTPPVGCVVNFTTNGTLPTNFATGTNYFVVQSTSGTSIEVSATAGGTAIQAGSAGSGTQTAMFNSIESSGSVTNNAALSLNAGDWDCTGTFLHVPASTSSKILIGLVSNSSGVGTAGTANTVQLFASFTSADNLSIPIGPAQFLLSSPTTVYLNSQNVFSSTAAGDGQLRCRRMR
jgi:hypothetical protein